MIRATAALQPPQPVEALVAQLTSSTVEAPSSTTSVIRPIVTPAQWQTVDSGVIGLYPLPASGPSRRSRTLGSSGTASPRSYSSPMPAAERGRPSTM